MQALKNNSSLRITYLGRGWDGWGVGMENLDGHGNQEPMLRWAASTHAPVPVWKTSSQAGWTAASGGECSRFVRLFAGDDFKGWPAPVAAPGADGAEAGAPATAGISKTGQKTLRVQKPLLNLHRPKSTGEGAAEGDAADKWIRKICMGTFEDTGKCKGYVLIYIHLRVSTRIRRTRPGEVWSSVSRGYLPPLLDMLWETPLLTLRVSIRWAFVDFTTAEHATVALTNPWNH
ncbi:hypothetical protein TRAPUB_4936 [Trametes pubescens]|uniref:Uncharacterized protein n=1 Tax=Trametes pubescens TaxID=154538 RepID=A0A1M2V9T0_TRAPU|nr:hypothetical protein TRAPUB_4936 [Trametes pubescens]